MSQTRRLAAILAADVAGYSRLMGADEEGTLERLKALRRELLDPKIAEHRGRIVKTTGDGLLVEFPSVVDAVRCAVEVQREMTGRNAGASGSSRRIAIRAEVSTITAVIRARRTANRRDPRSETVPRGAPHNPCRSPASDPPGWCPARGVSGRAARERPL
jgi:class 3 adenylate cyclase